MNKQSLYRKIICIQLKIKDFLISFCRAHLLYTTILLNLVYEIRFFIVLYIFLTLYTKINAIITFINVLKDIFAYFNVRADFNVNVNIIFNRKIKIIKYYSTILFEIIL